jgi:methionyl aminopeptidase
MGSKVHAHAVKNGYSVVREIGGHGIGLQFHEDPFVSYVSEPGTEMLMVPGMVFTIEPMVNMGTDKCVVLEDEWTTVTVDGQMSAHYENTIIITDGEPEILTMLK